MKTKILSIVIGIAAFVGLTGCTNQGVRFAREMAKNPATLSFSFKHSDQWSGQTDISFARSGTNNPASAQGGAASVNTKP